MDILEKMYEKGLSRRNFLVGAGATGAAAALAGCNQATVAATPTPAPAAYTDADILNFALNLEYLEAEFYLRAATGTGLAAADTGGTGTVNGGAKVPVAAGAAGVAQQNILNEIAYDEQQHVRFLRSALGNAAVSRPNIDLTNGFASAAAAANSLGGAVSATLPAIPASFNPFGSFDQFLVAAYVFEDVGVTAYLGAAPLISAAGVTAGFLNAAAGILAVEAYHASYVRTSLTANTINQGYTAYPYALFANRISNLRGALGGGNETLMTGFAATAQTAAQVGALTTATSGTTTTTTAVPVSNIVAASVANAIAYSRSTDQVMHIVYGSLGPNGATTSSAGLASGLFFPNGLNGNIKVTLS